MTPPSEGKIRASREWLVSLIAPLVSIAVFGITLNGIFVFDDVLISQGEKLKNFDLERIFSDNYWGSIRFDVNYRPFVLLTYSLNFLFGS